MTTPTKNSVVASNTPAANVAYIDALISGTKFWGAAIGTGVTLDYSFINANSVFQQDYGSESDSVDYLNAAQQQAARSALQLWGNVARITFRGVADNATVCGDIRFGIDTSLAGSSTAAHGYYPSNYWTSGGDVWLSPDEPTNNNDPYYNLTVGSGGFHTYVHELGHALGLKHSFSGNVILADAEDSELYTVMSYTHAPNSRFYELTVDPDGTEHYGYTHIVPDGPMLYDIAAIQYLYGANNTYRTGDDVYTFDPDKPFFRTLWDAGGNDTISTSNLAGACTIDLNAGHFSSISIVSDPAPDWYGNARDAYDGTDNLAIAFNVTIENASGGSANDTLIGNGAANRLTGNNGNDTLTGGAGNDTLGGGAGADSMVGGNGSDSYYVDNAGDRITETDATPATGGTDVVHSYLSAYTLGNNVENGRILAAGSANLTGNGLNNLLSAGVGNNVLNGSSGNDTVSYLYGVGGTSGVSVSLAVTTAQATRGSGSDTLIGIEHLTGSNYNDALTGNAGNNALQGGTGSDTLTGGLGGDGFRFIAAGEGGDRITDFNGNEGDKIQVKSTNFKGLAVGALVGANFAANATGVAIDGNDYFLFNTTSKSLWFDTDGNGAGAAVRLATLSNGVTLQAGNILVVA